jgi:hypothetical protein
MSSENENYFFRYGSVKQKTFLNALRHNKRETQRAFGAKTNIDASRMKLNYSLYGLGTADDVDNYARSQIALAGIKEIRKNAVFSVECIFSLPVSFHDKDNSAYFKDCLLWLQKKFEGELLTFDVHLDESAPHAHALILPILDGKLQGDKIKGNRTNVRERRESFIHEVGSKYGLKSKEFKSKAEKSELAKSVMKALENDSILKSVIYPWVRDAIFRNPEACAQMLDIKVKDHKMETKSFVDIKRSRGKGEFVK